MNIFNKILKECRKKIGYSQEKIAKCLGISKTPYVYYENGNRNIPENIYNQLDEKFNFKQFDIKELVADEIIDKIDKLNEYQLITISHKLDLLIKNIT